MNRPVTQFEAPQDAPSTAATLRVVGCGNPWAGDDGAGLEVVHRLRAAGGCECELLELPQAGVELMEVLDGARAVLFIDAVSSGAQPGTLYLIPLPSPVVEPRTLGSLSSHGWGLAEMLRLREALGRPSPRVLLVGIEIETAAPERPRSAAIEQAIRIAFDRFPVLCAMVSAGENALWKNPRCFLPGDRTFPGGSGEFPVAAGGM